MGKDILQCFQTETSNLACASVENISIADQTINLLKELQKTDKKIKIKSKLFSLEHVFSHIFCWS